MRPTGTAVPAYRCLARGPVCLPPAPPPGSPPGSPSGSSRTLARVVPHQALARCRAQAAAKPMDRRPLDRSTAGTHALTLGTSDVRGEQALWRAVIVQALMDAASNSAKPENIRARQLAAEWLSGGGDDFLSVCHHAGMDPEYVRVHALRCIAHGYRWRNAPGEGRAPRKRRQKKSCIWLTSAPATLPVAA